LNSIEDELKGAMSLFERDKQRLQSELDSQRAKLHDKEAAWTREKAELLARQELHSDCGLRAQTLEGQVTALKHQLQSALAQTHSYKQAAALAEEEAERYRALLTSRPVTQELPCYHEEEIATLRSQKAKLHEQNSTLQQELRSSNSQIYSLERQLLTMDRSIQEASRRSFVQQEHDFASTQDSQLRNQLDRLTTENSALIEASKQKDKENDRLVRKMLEITSESKLNSLQNTGQKPILKRNSSFEGRRNSSYEGRRTRRKCYACDQSR
jgi:hypothetical protein